MQVLKAFLKLVRWPNLVFIGLTQILFHFCIIKPSANGSAFHFPLQLNSHLFVLLSMASIAIAAAGYIINDYFDINIDLVNKPDKIIINKYISRRWALFWHLFLSLTGIVLSIIVSNAINNWLIAIINIVCVVLLWYYSTTYKRQLLIGNILISALTAWVIMVMLMAEFPNWVLNNSVNTTIEQITVVRLSRIAVLYAAFSFILSLIREAVKDLEDVPGDLKEGCKTMPIVWGAQAAKVFVGVWLVVLLATLVITIVYAFLLNWYLAAVYLMLLVFAPLVWLFKKLLKSRIVADYAALSKHIKWIMLSGILSMIMVYFYTK
ncbi:geranylgeranylglycerol-phosphate geranylgeranyltransferase [Polluticaenibacter yanchengensis]